MYQLFIPTQCRKPNFEYGFCFRKCFSSHDLQQHRKERFLVFPLCIMSWTSEDFQPHARERTLYARRVLLSELCKSSKITLYTLCHYEIKELCFTRTLQVLCLAHSRDICFKNDSTVAQISNSLYGFEKPFGFKCTCCVKAIPIWLILCFEIVIFVLFRSKDCIS